MALNRSKTDSNYQKRFLNGQKSCKTVGSLCRLKRLERLKNERSVTVSQRSERLGTWTNYSMTGWSRDGHGESTKMKEVL